MEQKKIKIAIVEDEDSVANELTRFIDRYMKENQREYSLIRFSTGTQFIYSYKNEYDLVLMDILMPGMDGMKTVSELRKIDDKVMVIFVTNLAQYAIKGYEVNAFDFVLKPVVYFNFAIKLDRVLANLSDNTDKTIIIKNKDSLRRIRVSRVLYIEVVNHMLIYHTLDGDFSATGTLKKMADELLLCDFALCNNCYLVNLKYVQRVDRLTLYIGDELLQISGRRHKEFMSSLNEYLSRSGG